MRAFLLPMSQPAQAQVGLVADEGDTFLVELADEPGQPPRPQARFQLGAFEDVQAVALPVFLDAFGGFAGAAQGAGEELAEVDAPFLQTGRHGGGLGLSQLAQRAFRVAGDVARPHGKRVRMANQVQVHEDPFKDDSAGPIGLGGFRPCPL